MEFGTGTEGVAVAYAICNHIGTFSSGAAHSWVGLLLLDPSGKLEHVTFELEMVRDSISNVEGPEYQLSFNQPGLVVQPRTAPHVFQMPNLGK